MPGVTYDRPMGEGGSLELVTLASDELVATVMPGAGARLHSVAAFGTDVLRTPGDQGSGPDAEVLAAARDGHFVARHSADD